MQTREPCIEHRLDHNSRPRLESTPAPPDCSSAPHVLSHPACSVFSETRSEVSDDSVASRDVDKGEKFLGMPGELKSAQHPHYVVWPAHNQPLQLT